MSTRTRRPGDGLEATVRAANVRAHNREVVLRLLWTERSTSRAEVARRTGLSRSTVSNIIEELFATTGVLREAGEGRSIGGKRPKMIAFDDDVYGIVGLDLGASHIGVALTNLRGHIVLWKRMAHDVRHDPEGTLKRVTDLITQSVQNTPKAMRRVIASAWPSPRPSIPRTPMCSRHASCPAGETFTSPKP